MPEIVSTVLLVLFIFLFFLSLLAFLAGFIKGLYKTTVKTLLIAALLCVFVFLTPSITIAIGNIDLSKIGFSFEFNGQQIVLTTIQETLANIITATGVISPMNGISIYETAIALANSLLSYVIFFVFVLLTQLFIWLFTAIVYNGIFRWFIPVESKEDRRLRKEMPKETRYLTQGIYFENEPASVEEREPEVIDPYQQEELLRGQENIPGQEYAEAFPEATTMEEETSEEVLPEDDYPVAETRHRLPLLRLPAAVLGACSEFVLAMVLVSPFTALARTALEHRETVSTVLSQLLPENDSQDIDSLMDTLEDSLLVKLLGVMNFDTTIMDSVSRVEIGGKDVSFNGLLSSVLDIASPLIDEGAIDFGSGVGAITVNFAQLLNGTMVSTLIDSIIENPIVMALIPPVIDIGVNTLSSESLPLSQLDFSDIDWSSDLSALSDIYSQIYGTGIIDSLFVEDGEKISPENIEIPVADWSAEQYQKNLASFAKAFEAFGDMEVMKKNLPMVFASVGTYLAGMGYDILPTDADSYAKVDWGHDIALFGTSALNLCRVLGVNISADIDIEAALDQKLDSLDNEVEVQKFVQDVETILCGDEKKKTDGLLDCTLFDIVRLGDVLDSVLSSVSAISSYVENIDFSVFDEMSIADLKVEFRSIFDVAELVLDPEFPIKLEEGLESIDLSSQEVANALVDVLNMAENSEIFSSMYPYIIQSFLSNPDLEIQDFMFGLTPYNFNFDSDNFTSDFKELVSLMPSLYETFEVLSNDKLTNAEKFKGINAVAIGDLLEIVADSNFFNPALSDGVDIDSDDANDGRNFNLYVVLSNLFRSDTFAQMGFVAPDLKTMSGIEWSGSNGEISRLVSLIQDAQTNADFLLDGAKGTVEDPDALRSMISTGFSSQLLEPSILAIIDSSMNEFLSSVGINKTLNQMRTEYWKEDVDPLIDILTLAGDMDFSDPDFFNSLDSVQLNALLTSLYRTNFIANCFGTPLTENMSSATIEAQRNRNFSEILASFIDYVDLFEKLDIDSFNMGSLYADSWADSVGEKEIDGIVYSYTESGEIAGLTQFFGLIQDMDIDNFDGSHLPEGFLTSISAESRSSMVVQSLLATIISSVVDQLQIDDSFRGAIQSIDFYKLVGMSADEIEVEFDFIQAIYDLSQPDASGTSPLDSLLDDIFSLDSESLVVFKNLTTKMALSTLMTEAGQGHSRAPIGELFFQIFAKTETPGKSLLEQMTLAQDANQYDFYFNGLLARVEDWTVEMDYINQFVEMFSQLGIDADNMTDVFLQGKNKEGVRSLLKSMNRSALFHKLPISLIHDNVYSSDGSGLDSLFVDPTTGRAKTVDFYVHLSTRNEDVSFWDNEIEYFVNLLFGLSDFLENGFAEITIGEGGVSTTLLYDLGSIELFRDVRSYIVYNLIDRTATDENQSLVADVFKDYLVYGENKDAYRLEELFFQNETLLDGQGRLIEEKSLADLKALDTILQLALDNLNVFATGSLADILGSRIKFEELTGQCFYEYGGAFCRSRLASEFVAGLMKMILGNDNVFSGLSSLPGGDSFVFKFTEDDYYGSNNQYPLVNPVEGRAIDGFLVALSTLPLDDAAIQDLFDSLNVDKAETDALYAEFAAKDYSDFPTSLFGRDDAVLSIVKLMVGDTLPDDFDPATMPYSFRS